MRPGGARPVLAWHLGEHGEASRMMPIVPARARAWAQGTSCERATCASGTQGADGGGASAQIAPGLRCCLRGLPRARGSQPGLCPPAPEQLHLLAAQRAWPWPCFFARPRLAGPPGSRHLRGRGGGHFVARAPDLPVAMTWGAAAVSCRSWAPGSYAGRQADLSCSGTPGTSSVWPCSAPWWVHFQAALVAAAASVAWLGGSPYWAKVVSWWSSEAFGVSLLCPFLLSLDRTGSGPARAAR